jgi:hypothetical protein
MTDNVYLNRDKTKVVPQYAEGKKWQVPRKEAIRLGLLKDEEEKPVQARRTAPKAEPQKRRLSNKGLNNGLNKDA